MKQVLNPSSLQGLVPTEGEKPVDNKLRSDWNAYTQWLDKKGLKGSPQLDKGDMGGKMIDQYRKENPTTLVTRESIVPIQKEFSKYRDYVLNEIKNKRAQFTPGANENNFMKDLSVVDGIPGQRTTSFAFPDSYLQTFLNDKLISTKNQGFVTMQK